MSQDPSNSNNSVKKVERCNSQDNEFHVKDEYLCVAKHIANQTHVSSHVGLLWCIQVLRQRYTLDFKIVGN